VVLGEHGGDDVIDRRGGPHLHTLVRLPWTHTNRERYQGESGELAIMDTQGREKGTSVSGASRRQTDTNELK
jgi:hypothetical protein